MPWASGKQVTCMCASCVEKEGPQGKQVHPKTRRRHEQLTTGAPGPKARVETDMSDAFEVCVPHLFSPIYYTFMHESTLEIHVT